MKYESANWSAATFEAAYGDWALMIESSFIGTLLGVPYTSLVEIWITCLIFLLMDELNIFNKPVTFVSI